MLTDSQPVGIPSCDNPFTVIFVDSGDVFFEDLSAGGRDVWEAFFKVINENIAQKAIIKILPFMINIIRRLLFVFRIFFMVSISVSCALSYGTLVSYFSKSCIIYVNLWEIEEKFTKMIHVQYSMEVEEIL